MYQSEAMWLSFSAAYPMAVKVAAGKVSALTGEPWHDNLSKKPNQDYMVIPEQPWLDGFYAGNGLIRQFLAMPLGDGYTAEEQLAGKGRHGGLQIVVYPIKAAAYEDRRPPEKIMMGTVPGAMGLAPGGLMRQQIHEDPFGISAWEQSVGSRCFVHILNSLQYVEVTNEKPPTTPPTAKDYTAAGLPWFDYYDAERKALTRPNKLSGLVSVAAEMALEGEGPLRDNEPVSPANVVKLSKKGPVVREGDF